jgi:hypothetical protein
MFLDVVFGYVCFLRDGSRRDAHQLAAFVKQPSVVGTLETSVLYLSRGEACTPVGTHILHSVVLSIIRFENGYPVFRKHIRSLGLIFYTE